MTDRVQVHLIDEDKGFLMSALMDHVPLVGDEMRINDNHFVRVTRRVWCMDEERPRINLGVEKVSL